jgi:hypothetical protein
MKRLILVGFTYLSWFAVGQTFAQNYSPTFIQLPSIQMRCLPNSQNVVFYFFWSNLPLDSTTRAETLASAQKQNIFIGYQKFGPFEENEGLLTLSCNTMGKSLKADFTYRNFPYLKLGDRQPNILAEGQCDDLSNLELKSIFLDDKVLAPIGPLTLNTCYQDAKLSSIEIDVIARNINLCTIPGPFEPTSPSAQRIECIAKKF